MSIVETADTARSAFGVLHDRPRVAVLHAPGTNRDGEAALALDAAGAAAEIVLVDDRPRLSDYAAVVVPGGFSHGDALGAGARLALDVAAELRAFADTGRVVLGICNGFQALVRGGLLPGTLAGTPGGGATGSATTGSTRRVTLTHNESGRFVCRWVHLAADTSATADIAAFLPEVLTCPVAHGEGRIAVDSAETLDALQRGGHVLFRYVRAPGVSDEQRDAEGLVGHNPNGSAGDIAGLCDATGSIWGLMPHPEDHIITAQHPRRDPKAGLGLGLFAALVDRARRA
jgi:phosphoribosylformylglycinamidine synthase subunit PurQ / glutaminase